MAVRFCVLGDIHGNVAALDAALADMKRHRPDRLLITGDLVFNGPRPAEALDRVRALEAGGAVVVQGNTDVAVADFDYSAAFPWLEQVPAGHRAAAEWAHDQLSDDQLDYLRRLPAERRLWVDGLMILICHGSPGSQTAGMSADLDLSVTVERATRTDARVIACGHTHVADVRELGRKLIVNPGSCGSPFDGDPAACWALLTIPDQDSPHDGEAEADADADADVISPASAEAEFDSDTGQPAEVDPTQPSAQLFRPAYDVGAVAEEVAARGLPGDVYRAATIRTGRLIR